MTTDLKVDDLEKALLERANALSQEYYDRAKRSHDQYIEDENERLRLREEREIMAAEMLAEQNYRSKVQASELHSQKKLDQIRWELVQNVLKDVSISLQKIVENDDRYFKLLTDYLSQAAELLQSNNLIVEMNERDFQHINSHWEELLKVIKVSKSIRLVDTYCQCSGGFMIYDEQRRMRINNTFEGLLERLAGEIHQMIVENLFSEVIHEGAKIHGG